MADVSAELKDWSIIPSSNQPADATTIGAGMADNFQQIQATVRAAFAHKGSDLNSAATIDLGANTGFYHDIVGATGPITSFGTVSAGVSKVLQFDSTPTITHNATSMILPGGTSITMTAGSHLMAMSLGAGNWIVPWCTEAPVRGVVSVKDFGAVGDGVTDDTAEIQAALTYAAANSRALFFPKGTYLISSTLTYDWPDTSGSLRLYGETIGRGFSGSFLQWTGAAGGTMWKSTGTNSLVMENIGWDGNLLADKLVWCESGVSSSDMQFVNCKFSGGRRTTKSVGLQCGSSTVQVSEVTIDRCLFQACYYGLLEFTANVKNFKVVNSGASLCFWGFCHGDPDSSVSLSGQFLVQGTVFSLNGDIAVGFFNGVAGNVDVGGDIFISDGTVISCETEGSSRFINTPDGNIGNNFGTVTAIGNHLEGMDPPADDYVIRVGGGLVLIGNYLWNNRTGSAVAKVQSFAIANRYVSPTTLSQGITSNSNCYQNAASYAPIYDGSDNLLTDPLTSSSSNRCSVYTFGDMGGAPGAIVSLEEVFLTGSAAMARLVRQNATNCTWVYSGLLSIGVNKVTVPYTALVAAALDARITVYTIPERTKITNVVADVTAAFTGLAGSTTVEIGDGTGSEDEFLLTFDVKSSVVTKGLADADLGALLARATAIQGGTYYWGAGNIVRAHFVSGSGNFGNGSVTNLSAGSMDIYITVERMP